MTMHESSQTASASPTIPPFSTAEMRSYPLGTLVYRSGLMPLETVNRALAEAAESGRRLGRGPARLRLARARSDAPARSPERTGVRRPHRVSDRPRGRAFAAAVSRGDVLRFAAQPRGRLHSRRGARRRQRVASDQAASSAARPDPARDRCSLRHQGRNRAGAHRAAGNDHADGAGRDGGRGRRRSRSRRPSIASK